MPLLCFYALQKCSRKKTVQSRLVIKATLRLCNQFLVKSLFSSQTFFVALIKKSGLEQAFFINWYFDSLLTGQNHELKKYERMTHVWCMMYHLKWNEWFWVDFFWVQIDRNSLNFSPICSLSFICWGSCDVGSLLPAFA